MSPYLFQLLITIDLYFMVELKSSQVGFKTGQIRSLPCSIVLERRLWEKGSKHGMDMPSLKKFLWSGRDGCSGRTEQ